MTEERLRAHFALIREALAGRGPAAIAARDLADSVERVLDLCVEYEASNDEHDGFPDVEVDVRLVRAALYGTTQKTR